MPRRRASGSGLERVPRPGRFWLQVAARERHPALVRLAHDDDDVAALRLATGGGLTAKQIEQGELPATWPKPAYPVRNRVALANSVRSPARRSARFSSVAVT